MAYLVGPKDVAPVRQELLNPDPTLPTTCVIGAGSSGIAAAKALYEAHLPFDCFELGSDIGGTWVYQNSNSQSACYETLEINTSCPRMAYSDFPMPKGYPHYAAHHQVANGHHWDARLPDPAYPGTFDGEQIRSHAYGSAAELVGRDVVIVGAGNSATDIAVEASKVARSAVISQRRGQWVLPKFVLGKPADQVTPPSWMPFWATKAKMAFGARLAGNVAKLGLSQPEHKPGESHPVQSEGIRGALRSGTLVPKPGIDRLDGDRVIFTDGTSVPCDLLIWATGYNVTFPFLDPDLVSAQGNDLPLWKRMVHPGLPGLFFIGLLQPLGAVMPLAEAQSVLVADLLTGHYFLPAALELRQQMAADHAAYKKRFYVSARHTMEVDFDHYLWELERERKRGAA